MNIPSLKQAGLQALSLALATLAVANAGLYVLAPLSGAEFKIALATIVAAEIGVLVASWAFLPLVRRWHVPGAVVAAALLAVCLSSTLTSAGGYVWQRHQARVVVAEATEAKRERAEKAVEGAEAALAPYTKVRAEDAIRASLRLCQTKSCRERVDRELVLSGEKVALEAALLKATAGLGAAPPAMPPEHPVAALIVRLRPSVHVQTADLWVALAALGFLQLAAPLAGILSGCFGAPRAAPATAHKRAEKSAKSSAAAPSGTPNAAPEVGAPKNMQQPQLDEYGAETDPRTEKVVQFVRAAGGVVRTSQRRLAKELDMHPIATGHAIAACSALGLLVVEASRSGTVLRLV